MAKPMLSESCGNSDTTDLANASFLGLSPHSTSRRLTTMLFDIIKRVRKLILAILCTKKPADWGFDNRVCIADACLAFEEPKTRKIM